MARIQGSPVLVVEDDANIAHLLATYLRRDGFEMLLAADGAQALPAAHAEAEKVLLALGNLVENAWQYAPSGGTLRVEPAQLDGEIRAIFSNESSVVTDDDLSLIFERFYRTEQSRSRNHGGAGIGLSVVKEIIEAHGGRVGADHADGRLRIWFSLPAVS